MTAGERFGDYRIKENLASGGMADVVRAERVGALGVTREVCIKRIRRELCRDTAFVEMFIDEARISSTLRHGNIVAVEHFGMVDETLFMAMEWVHGVDASKLLERVSSHGQTLPIDAALYIVNALLMGLEYAHGKTDDRGQWLRIVHRDVSPHNLLVSFEGDVKLTDFGIAKATSRIHQTQGGMIKGKVPYMAPEQARGLTLDSRTDLFAVGISAYELLTGRRPYNGASATDCVLTMLREERPPMRDLRAAISPEVEAFVSRLLQSAPSDRFQTASEAIDSLTPMPALRTGQRTLKRLLRELYDGDAFSTLTPRFDNNALAGVNAYEATIAARPVATRRDAQRSVVAPPADEDCATVVRAGPKVSARPATMPATREHRPIDPTPGPIAVVRASEEGTAAASPRAKRSLGVITAVGATLVFGVGAGSVGTVAMLQRGSNSSAALSGTTAARRGDESPEARMLVDAGTTAMAHDATVDVVAAATQNATPQLATVTVTAVPWGMLTIDGLHLTETHAMWRVPPGHHRVSATRMGVTITRNVSLASGERQNVRIVFPRNSAQGQ